ncbi:MAG: hypothetical protein GX418_15095 [Clostridiales bacterium]|nr:hypothetical protein [Clostridiales bacterium]
MFVVEWKLSRPAQGDFRRELETGPRVAALSGGNGRGEADARPARNHGLIASYCRAQSGIASPGSVQGQEKLR